MKVKIDIENYDLYDRIPPENGMEGFLIGTTFHRGLKDMFGVEVPLKIVKINMDTGIEIFHFFEDDVKEIK